MPSEPDKQIEQLLKGYAQQRRGAADPSAQMPAATRNLLHAEIAKLASAGSKADSWLERLSLGWPHWVFTATATAAVVIVAVALFIPNTDKLRQQAKADRERELVYSIQSKQVEFKDQKIATLGNAPTKTDSLYVNGTSFGQASPAAPSAPEPPAISAPVVMAPAPLPAKGFEVAMSRRAKAEADAAKIGDLSAEVGTSSKKVTIARAAKSAAKEPSAPAPYSLATTPATRPTTPAPAPAETERPAAMQPSAAPVAVASTVTPATATAAPAAADGYQNVAGLNLAMSARGGGKMPGDYSYNFRNLAVVGGELLTGRSATAKNAESVENRVRPDAKPAAPSPVLASFSLVQRGNRVVIVDGDGSVYEGAVLSALAPAQSAVGSQLQGKVAANQPQLDGEMADKVGPQPTLPKPSGIKLDESIRQEDATRNRVVFTVAGLNRSLNKKVVITAMLNRADPRQSGWIDADSGKLRLAKETNDWKIVDVLKNLEGQGGVAGGGVLVSPPAHPAKAKETLAPPVGVTQTDSPVALLPVLLQGKIRVGDDQELDLNAIEAR